MSIQTTITAALLCDIEIQAMTINLACHITVFIYKLYIWQHSYVPTYGGGIKQCNYPSICLSIRLPLAQKWCTVWLWSLMNTNRKLNAPVSQTWPKWQCNLTQASSAFTRWLHYQYAITKLPSAGASLQLSKNLILLSTSSLLVI